MENLVLAPRQISERLRSIGKKKATASIFELLVFAVLAGIYIAFGANATIAVLSAGTLDAGLTMFLSASVFTVGLMLVLIPGSELFTGNILMTIGFIYRQYSFIKVLKNWVVVYIGNLIGAIIIAYFVFNAGLLGRIGNLTAMGEVALSITEVKLGLSFTQALFRGVLCNMLVCLAVIMCIASKSAVGKIFGIYFPIMAFVVSGYEHSVANMYFLPVGLIVKGEFISGFWTMFNNLIPVTIGNVIGGLLIVLLHPKVEEKIARSIIG